MYATASISREDFPADVQICFQRGKSCLETVLIMTETLATGGEGMGVMHDNLKVEFSLFENKSKNVTLIKKSSLWSMDPRFTNKGTHQS